MPKDAMVARLAAELLAQIDGSYDDGTGNYEHPDKLENSPMTFRYPLVTLQPKVAAFLTTCLDRWDSLSGDQRRWVAQACGTVGTDLEALRDIHRSVRESEHMAHAPAAKRTDTIWLPPRAFFTQMVPITIPRLRLALRGIAGKQSAPASPAAENNAVPMFGDDVVRTVNRMLANDPEWNWKTTKNWLGKHHVSILDRDGWRRQFGSEPPARKGNVAIVNESDLMKAIRTEQETDNRAFERMDSLEDRKASRRRK